MKKRKHDNGIAVDEVGNIRRKVIREGLSEEAIFELKPE
jgi:hypothetical protein